MRHLLSPLERALRFFGIIASVLALLSLIFFIPVLVEYIKTGLVPHFPTLIVCGFSAIAAIQSLFSGLILENIQQKNRQDFEMALINIRHHYLEKKGAEND